MVKLNERCVLVDVRSTAPGKTREDKKITGDVIAQHQASAKAGRWVKELYPNDIVSEPVKIGEQIRGLINEYSFEWRSGQRMVPVTALMELKPKIQALLPKYQAAVTVARDRFPSELQQAQQRDNGLFNRDQYPVDADAFARKFSLKIQYLPVPDKSHIILDMAQDMVDEVTESTQMQLAEVEERSRRELWTRLIEPVRDLLAKLADYDQKKGTGQRTAMHDTIVTNIKDIVALVPHLNITGDPTLDALAKEVEQLTRYGADTLKESTPSRNRVADQAKNILAKLEAQQPKAF